MQVKRSTNFDLFSTRCFGFASFLLPLRNSVAPNSFTSYFVLRTSYLIAPVLPRDEVIALL